MAVFIAPPSVMRANGKLTGFSVELWNAIADRLKLRTTYQVEPDLGALEHAMRSREVDMTVAPVFITSARGAEFDFTLPILQAGLQVMVRNTGRSAWSQTPLGDMIYLLFSRTTAVWLGVALVLVLIPSHLVWWFERDKEHGIVSSRSYFPGILEAMYWALSTLTTQAEAMPRQWVGRLIAILWMFVGVVFVAFYTAQLTTVLTVEQIRGAIEGPNDLPGKKVGTLAGSAAVDSLRERKAIVTEYQTPGEMFEALSDKNVDAIVTGAPMLLYYAGHDGKGLVKVVGPQFDDAPLAIMLQLDSPLRRPIDLALTALHEDGTYERLYEQWFGTHW